MEHETPAQKQARIECDLEALRILAWCVQRNRYSAEPVRIEGGRRGKARMRVGCLAPQQIGHWADFNASGLF